MRRKDRPFLGIELHEGELRLASVVDRNGNPAIDVVGSTKLPPGAVKGGNLLDPAAVSVALKRLVESKGIASIRECVVGIPAGGTVVRSIQVPPAPDDEMPLIVAGEVEHYNIIGAGGAHAYLQLSTPSKGATELVSLVVAGVQPKVVTMVHELGTRTGLDIVSLEPVEFAMCRLCLASLGTSATAFIVVITGSTTTLSYFKDGKLWTHRQLDTGLNGLLQKGSDEEVDRSTVLALSKEIRRTAEYLVRTHGAEAPVEKVHVVTSEPNLLPVPLMLSEFLETAVQLHTPEEAVPYVGNNREDIAALDAVKYSAAIGLALQRGALARSAPPLDLFASLRTVAKEGAQKRNLLLTYAVAGVVAFAGACGMLIYQMQISKAARNLQFLESQAKSIRESTSTSERERALDLDQYRLLRSQGVPVVSLMDYVTATLPGSVGLTSITIDSTKNVRMVGDSRDEQSIMQLLRSLQSVPVIQYPRLDAMRNEPEKGGVSFTIAGTMVGMDKVRVPRTGGQP